jgi:hypothetical protein
MLLAASTRLAEGLDYMRKKHIYQIYYNKNMRIFFFAYVQVCWNLLTQSYSRLPRHTQALT